RAGGELARRLIVPDFQLQLQYRQWGTGQGAINPPLLTAGIGLTLPLGNQYQGELARAAADLRQQQLRHERLRAQVIAEVETAYAAFHVAQRRVTRMEGALLERVKRARDLLAFQYQKGGAS